MNQYRWASFSGGNAPFVECRPALSVAGDEGFSDALVERMLGRQQRTPYQAGTSRTTTQGYGSTFIPAVRSLMRHAAERARVIQNKWRSQ